MHIDMDGRDLREVTSDAAQQTQNMGSSMDLMAYGANTIEQRYFL
jgi:hypothetical protein